MNPAEHAAIDAVLDGIARQRAEKAGQGIIMQEYITGLTADRKLIVVDMTGSRDPNQTGFYIRIGDLDPSGEVILDEELRHFGSQGGHPQQSERNGSPRPGYVYTKLGKIEKPIYADDGSITLSGVPLIALSTLFPGKACALTLPPRPARGAPVAFDDEW